jgi:hypothetical protein
VIDAGTSIVYTRTFDAYPASAGWALTLYLAGASIASVAGAANGDSWDVTLTPAATGLLAAGAYTWVERVSKAAEAYDVERGTVTVRPDIATAGPGAFQSWEEKTLVVVEAALSGQLTSGIVNYQIHGRSVGKIPPKELMEIRAALRSTVAQQKIGGFGRPIGVRFTQAGQ